MVSELGDDGELRLSEMEWCGAGQEHAGAWSPRCPAGEKKACVLRGRLTQNTQISGVPLASFAKQRGAS